MNPSEGEVQGLSYHLNHWKCTVNSSLYLWQ